MSKTRMSLGNFFLLCLLILFMGLYGYEHARSTRLQSRLDRSVLPLRMEIQRLKSSIAKRETQLEFAINGLQKPLSQREWSPLTKNTSGMQAIPLGTRRRLASIRNSQLKLDREKEQLNDLNQRLKSILVDHPNQE